LLREVDFSAKLGVDVFNMDASWYLGSSKKGTGDWGCGHGHYADDRQKYPSGLASISHRVHEVGMKFGLWCSRPPGEILSCTSATAICCSMTLINCWRLGIRSRANGRPSSLFRHPVVRLLSWHFGPRVHKKRFSYYSRDSDRWDLRGEFRKPERSRFRDRGRRLALEGNSCFAGAPSHVGGGFCTDALSWFLELVGEVMFCRCSG
jgi:hypothetical protein